MGESCDDCAGVFPEAKVSEGWRRQRDRIESGNEVRLAGRCMVVEWWTTGFRKKT